MIYIVEIPHQRKPFAWYAGDEEEAIGIIQDVNKHRDFDDQMACVTFEDWTAYNGRDLYTQHVFMSDAEAVEGLDLIGGHGAVEAILDLRNVLVATGAIQDIEEVIE